jgi:hypothetical protein
MGRARGGIGCGGRRNEATSRRDARVSDFGEQWNDIKHLNETAGPSLHEQQRHRVRSLAGRPNEVDVGSVHLGNEMIEAIQPRFALAPVVVSGPIVCQSAQIVGVSTGGPSGALDRGWPACLLQTKPEICDFGFRDLNGHRFEQHWRPRILVLKGMAFRAVQRALDPVCSW